MLKSVRVAIRVDASAQIGTGHLKRCFSLAQELKKSGAIVRFFVRDLGLDYTKIIEDRYHVSTLMPPRTDQADGLASAIKHAFWAGVPQSIDAQEFSASADSFAPQLVFVDHYAFDAVWHSQVVAKLGCKLVAIDDLADRKMAVDLLVDHNWHADHRRKYGDFLDSSAILLGGPRYALLDPHYAEAPKYVFGQEVLSIGIFMGGADLINASTFALNSVDAAGFDGPIELVTTDATPHLEQIRLSVGARPKSQLSVNLPNLAAFFAKHDLHIGAGGGALLERCCIGAPTIAAICAENQRQSIPPLEALNAVVSYDLIAANVGQGSLALADLLRDLIETPEKRARMSDSAKRLVDGKGCARIAEMALMLIG